MKTKLLILISCLTIAGSGYAACDQCSSGGCDAQGACSCVDPACGAPYSCMSGSECCAAFGNIGAFDSTPESNDTDYSYSTTNLITDDFAQNQVVPYHPSYKGEGYNSFKAE